MLKIHYVRYIKNIWFYAFITICNALRNYKIEFFIGMQIFTLSTATSKLDYC